MFIDEQGIHRCFWCEGHEDYIAYHDAEWGCPVNDDIRLFEKVCLEGFQSGLSWLTILRKRADFREAFLNFDFHEVSKFGQRDIERLMGNARIVRHRGKIEAAINNASRAVEMEAEFGSLARWFWQYEPVPVPPVTSHYEAKQRTTCDQAITMSSHLKKRGWKFVGPTTAYAFMQAMGMVNDHLSACDRYDAVEILRTGFTRPA